MPAVGVIGAGTMGAGIAQLAATRGWTVFLHDVNGELVHNATEGIAARLARSVEKGRMTEDEREAALGRIRPVEAIQAVGDVDLAIEAVVEDLTVKQRVFRDLEQATPTSSVLATNTSSLSISKIAEGLDSAQRVVGMHFFNPAPVMPLVEIIAGEQSDPACVDRAFEIAKSWGKTPVRVKDTPGFIVNRVARGFYLEALRLLGEGVAGVDEIDNIMRSLGGFRMGPFELMDLVGVDVNLAVSTSVWEQMGRPSRLAPHDIQRKLVGQGHLGRKTGRGFYLYENQAAFPAYRVDRRSFDLSPMLRDAMAAFCSRAGVKGAGTTEGFVIARILAALMNEAALALAEGVATREDIDLAMTKGTNYPSGPLAWAEKIGHRTVRGVLKALNQLASDGRYEPAALFADAE